MYVQNINAQALRRRTYSLGNINPALHLGFNLEHMYVIWAWLSTLFVPLNFINPKSSLP